MSGNMLTTNLRQTITKCGWHLWPAEETEANSRFYSTMPKLSSSP
uniref:Uncharacterized protein n=1 Tax=Arundo donax TaxID=35708 RepID=A0A0A9B9H8_ARUDO